jgi:hypothetical protein
MPYTCPKCLSESTYFVMPKGTELKCMDCEHVWPFRFLVFIQEWKEKLTAAS